MDKQKQILKKIFAGKELFFVGGPCVIESERLTFDIAQRLKNICLALKIPFIFKASYDKANRTSIDSYRGPGLKKGLKMLKQIREKLNIPILTDVHCVQHISEVASIVDVIQIPAFLSRQTDLIVETAKTGKYLNIKKGQFISPEAFVYTVEKAMSTGNRNIFITERGYTFGYNNLIVDMRNFFLLKKLTQCKIIFDATHSVQLPSGAGCISGGEREFIAPLAKAAVASGANGIFMEIHPIPAKAKCDPHSSFPLNKIKILLNLLQKIYSVVTDG